MASTEPFGARVYQAIHSRNFRMLGSSGGVSITPVTGLKLRAGPRAQGPHHAHHLAGRERHLDDVALLEDEAVRHRVAVGGVQRERDEDVGDLMHVIRVREPGAPMRDVNLFEP